MPQDRAPSRLRDNVPMVNKDGTLTQAGALGLEEIWRQIVSGFPVIPCVVTNAGNVYTLTARLHEEGARTYGDGMVFWGRASAGSTGSVTAKVATAAGTELATIKVYKDGGSTQAGNTDIVANRYYLWCYGAALDGNAGGLVLK